MDKINKTVLKGKKLKANKKADSNNHKIVRNKLLTVAFSFISVSDIKI